tara:strand:+ start:241 stop:708 length:468 start_codon:yes stop_codon:yes gene_type:complete
MPQLKKWQVNTIVDAICADITNGAEDTKAILYETIEYKRIDSDVQRAINLKDKVDEAQYLLDDLTKEITHSIDSFNREICSKAFQLEQYTSYSYRNSRTTMPSININLKGYHSVFGDIFSKVAFALLPKDATENIEQIKTDIASEYLDKGTELYS